MKQRRFCLITSSSFSKYCTMKRCCTRLPTYPPPPPEPWAARRKLVYQLCVQLLEFACSPLPPKQFFYKGMGRLLKKTKLFPRYQLFFAPKRLYWLPFASVDSNKARDKYVQRLLRARARRKKSHNLQQGS